MATLSPTVHEPATGRGGNDIVPPDHLGGNDGRGDDFFNNYGRRLRRARLGLALATAPIVTLFLTLSAIYLVRRQSVVLDASGTSYVRDWHPTILPVRLLLVNTFLLLLSSVTAELARRQITRQAALAPVRSIPGVSLGRERNWPWLGLTTILGLSFLTGQWLAWRELAARGFFIATSASSAFVYLLTAAHAVHLVGGLLVLQYAATAAVLKKSIDSRRIMVDVTAWYWHLMLALWVYLFLFLWLVR